MKLIGIVSGHLLGMKERFKDYHRSYANQTYVKSIESAGGVPIILPLIENSQQAQTYLSLVSGIVLTGGEDVNPKLYNQDKKIETKVISDIRDLTDSLYYKAALKFNKPVFAICRGMQLINSISSGTLFQDLKYTNNESVLRHDQINGQNKKTHDIYISDQTSLLFDAVKKKKISVNSFHHQAIDKLAPNFKVVAKTSDGIIEAIESTFKPVVMAVQWHPEMSANAGDQESIDIFKKFIKETNEV